LVLALHDAPIVECDEDQADAVAALLRQVMLAACRNDFVPFEVEVSVGPSLAGGKIIDPPAVRPATRRAMTKIAHDGV
jgi:hypothetical protein